MGFLDPDNEDMEAIKNTMSKVGDWYVGLLSIALILSLTVLRDLRAKAQEHRAK